MLYTQDEVNRIVDSQINKLLQEIVKNSSQCQCCDCYHPEFSSCFLAFLCLQQDFKAFVKKGDRIYP